jgi:soluble lytic murein transglycosylase
MMSVRQYGLYVLSALCLSVLLIAGCGRSSGSDDLVPERQEGDAADAVSQIDVVELPANARAFLETDRPWRAALAMRRFEEAEGEWTQELRVLAARAEAGWGEWTRVRELLHGAADLETLEDGTGLYLMARAEDAVGAPAEAARLYRAFLDLAPAAGTLDLERSAARVRLALAEVRAKQDSRVSESEARAALGGAARWLPLLYADAVAATGDLDAVTEMVGGYSTGYEGLRAWKARINAALTAGEVQQARRLARRAADWAQTATTRAEFTLAEGEAALEAGDVPGARTAFRRTISTQPGGEFAERARVRLQEGTMSPADHLAVARAYRAQGLHEESLEGFRAWLDAREGTPADRDRIRLEFADALFYAHRYRDVEPTLAPIIQQTSARMLLARAQAYLGDSDAAVESYRAVERAERGRDQGALAMLLAADVLQAEGDTDGAEELFRALMQGYPGHPHMGLGMMRLAGMAFLDADYAAASRIWDDYLQRYPGGGLALQATYWSGRAHEAAGNVAAANRRYQRVRQLERDSYYAMLASEHIGVEFWPVPMGQSPSVSESAERQVAEWMRGIDVLSEAGFGDEASAEADRVVAMAGGGRDVRYALAEALIARGYSQRAIRIGLALQSGGLNPRLMRILYPFPYRTLIEEEARSRDLDPYISAALIRQESMFEKRITSHVGARGLMQIMPATGRRLAEAASIEPWHPELLYYPEINVHLGTRYVARHWQAFDGSLPAVFSAYNAGSHRVELWKEYPEYGQDALFTERIPFRETRDYVKILTRNHAIYRGLYGDVGGE